MPIISDLYKFIFICAPATGSSAVAKTILDNNSGEWIPKEDLKNSEGKILVDFKHGTFKELKKYNLLSEAQTTYFKFVGIRNPFDFFVADYIRWRDKWSKWPDDPTKPRWVLRPSAQKNIKLATEKDFPTWLRLKLKDKKPGNFLNYWTAETDFQIRQEYLQVDFEYVKEILKLPKNIEIPVHNQTEERDKSIPYQEFYDSDLVDFVYNLYGAWMEKQGYKF